MRIFLPRLLSFYGKIFEAYKKLSQKNIAHRDIKPENIIVTKKPDGVVELLFIDFGVSTSDNIDQARRSIRHKGTPYYKPNNTEPLSSSGSDTFAFLQIAHPI